MDEFSDMFNEIEELEPVEELEYSDEDKYAYFNQYTRLSNANHDMEQKILGLKRERERLRGKLAELQEEYGTHKRNRRLAKDISRSFICDICQKAYGSETSLKNHKRIKHSGKDSK